MTRFEIQVDNEEPEVWYADHHFTEVWHCDQPNRYRVLREQWNWTGKDHIRHVYEVEAV